MAELNFVQLKLQESQLPSDLVITDSNDTFAIVEICGDDAGVFLQGQLSADILGLGDNQCTTAALCNPKGRVLASMEVLRGKDKFLVVMLHQMMETVVAHLQKYVMRSKVRFNIIESLHPISATTRNLTKIEAGYCQTSEQSLAFVPRWMTRNDPQWCISNQSLDADDVLALTWAQAHLLWGYAHVNSHTTLQHIPQSLRLDELEAISFTKGCYTGQEIIARVHHRGKVSRRLKRFLVESPANIDYGDALKTEADGVAGEVVEIARDANQNTAILAVVKESATATSVNGASLSEWPFDTSQT